MRLKLSDLEIGILQKLVNGEAVSISSQQRVRLELAGMIREGPDGIAVTITGRNLAREKSPEATATDSALGVGRVMAIIAAGNGLGSGIVMTLGADAAPQEGRAQFLGGWRLCGDIGNTGGPLLVSAVAAIAPLAAAPVVIGTLALLGAVWVGHWTGKADRKRRG